MARLFAPPKATGPSGNKKGGPAPSNKKDAPEKPAGGTQERENKGKE